MAHNQQWFSEPTIHACFREAVKATAGQHGDVAQTWIDSLEKRLVGTLAARLRLEGATEMLPPKSDLRWQLKLDAAEARGREMRAGLHRKLNEIRTIVTSAADLNDERGTIMATLDD